MKISCGQTIATTHISSVFSILFNIEHAINHKDLESAITAVTFNWIIQLYLLTFSSRSVVVKAGVHIVLKNYFIFELNLEAQQLRADLL